MYNDNNVYGVVEMTEHEAQIMVRDYKKKLLGKKRKNGIVYVLLDLGDGVGYPINKTFTSNNIKELIGNYNGGVIYVKFKMLVQDSKTLYTIEDVPGILTKITSDKTFLINPWGVFTNEITTITPEEYCSLQPLLYETLGWNELALGGD